MSLFDRLRRKPTVAPAPDALACQELVEIITDYLEGALSPADRERFEDHIRGCGDCTAYLKQMRQTVALVGRFRQEDIPVPALEPLLVAFRTWKQGQAPDPSGGAA